MKQYQVVIPVYKQMLINVPDTIEDIDDIDEYIKNELFETDLDREDTHYTDFDNVDINLIEE